MSARSRPRAGWCWSLRLPWTLSCALALPYEEPIPERGPELCSNGRDDDFDDATDCESPDCARFCVPAVRAPAPPALSCRAPWVSEAFPARDGLSRCAVPDDFPDRRASCALTEACELPFCAFVRPGATGGDGTEALPFGTVAEALATLGDRVWTLQLSPGTYHEAIVVSSRLTIEGGCAATIEDDGDPSTPLIDAQAGHLELIGLQLHLDPLAERPIAPAIRVGTGARVTVTGVVLDGPSRIALEDDAVFAAASSRLDLAVGTTTCPDELDPCDGYECGAAYECRPSLETCTTSCATDCPAGTTCDQLIGVCRDLVNVCGRRCSPDAACRAGVDAFRCVPRPCEHAIALGRGAALSIVDSRVRSDARVLLAASTADQGGPGRIVLDHTLLEQMSGALGRVAGLRCSVEITDSIVRSTGLRAGPWLTVVDSARVAIQRTELALADEAVMEVSGNADAPEPWTAGVVLTDVLVHGWDPSAPVRRGAAAFSLSGASFSAERVAALGHPGSAFVAGVGFVGEDPGARRMSLRDVLVTGVDASTPLLDASTVAVGVLGSSCLEASALRIERPEGVGLLVASSCAHEIEDVAVVAGRPRGCTESCDQAGVGILLGNATAGAMRRFEVDRVNGCAISRSVRARIAPSEGLLRRSVVGLCLQDTLPAPSYDAYADGLVLRDNQSDLVLGAPPSAAARCLPAVAARCGTPFVPE